MEEAVYPKSTTANDGISYCVWGMVALIVGLFIFGIPCGLLATHLGSEGIKHEAVTFGTVVKVGGWAEVIITALGIVAMMAGNAGVH